MVMIGTSAHGYEASIGGESFLKDGVGCRVRGVLIMNAFRRSSGRTAVLAGLASALLIAAWPAAAATFTVNSVADAPDADLADGICADSSGLCTLRAAIMQANALGGTNVIDLSQIVDPATPIVLSIPGADETVTGNATTGFTVVAGHDASKGDLNITSSMDIIGAGSDKTIIEWSPTVKQTPANGDRVFHIEAVTSNIAVNISGVTIENGVTPPAEVLQTNSDGTYYQFERSGAGIAIGPAAAVTYIDPAASGGSSGDEGGGSGGGESGGESSATVTGVTLTDVRILDNQSGAAGGGISSAAPLTLNNVTVSGNTAVTNGGGIYNDAQLTVMNSTIGTTSTLTTPNSAEGGGGMFDTGMHNTVIEESAIVGNQAVGGGGLSVRSLVNMSIVNTTINGNAATDVGGGITTNGPVTLQNDTISDNTAANDSTSGGAGVNAFGSGLYQFVNTMFQANVATGSNSPSNCGCSGSSCKSGVMVSLGHNLADDATCALSGAGDMANTSAGLGAMAANGGPTETRALVSGSPAVDAGDNANCPNTDQRGSMRPADGNLRNTEICDIGAFELFVPRADLHVSGKGGPDKVPHGAAAKVSFQFTNDSTTASDATGVQITTDPLPANYSFGGATMTTSAGTSDCAWDSNTRVVTCDVGTLAQGQSVNFDLDGTGTARGTIAITAHVTAAAPTDISTDNNSATVTMYVQGVSNLEITATAPSQQLQVNSQGSMSVTVKNLGPDSATNVRVLARLSNGMMIRTMQMLSGGGSGVNCATQSDQISAVCTVPTIAAGQSGTVTVQITPTAAGTTELTLQVATDDVDPDNTNDSVVVPLTIAAETTPVTPTTPTSTSSGGGGCAYQPGGPLDPTLLVIAAIGVAGVGARRLRRTQKLAQRVK